ncbi:Uncharacterised protein [Vibrio cholerae]|nr:Uncharacterised protein [Vibrio cholerae]
MPCYWFSWVPLCRPRSALGSRSLHRRCCFLFRRTMCHHRSA